MNQRSAISKINRNGMLLVFPVHNKKEPKSLWSEFFPRKKMRWVWDESGDSGVGDLWNLMKRLSDSRQVVYTKWYRGRATFISRELFTAMLKIENGRGGYDEELSPTASTVLETLEADSPLSTKQLKRCAELQGKLNEPFYNRAMKELFSKLLIVAFGEVDDGAFPSLALGATKTLFEDLWMQSQNLSEPEAQSILDRHLPVGSSFRKFFECQNMKN